MTPSPESFYIGWDVGGWNCDHNQNSRDAIVILSHDLSIVGRPWRGNLRVTINEATDAVGFIQGLFRLCKDSLPTSSLQVTMAIDTPLGFSEEIIGLISGLKHIGPLEDSGNNRYLFRQTERHLFAKGLKPLSPVKDMIGSQATKGMHVLAKFAPTVESCGVWTDGHGFRAIEAYPSACRNSEVILNLLNASAPLGHNDLDDARVCALIAYLFSATQETLDPPPHDVSLREGWIWVPHQTELSKMQKAKG
jgi:hypothetical protein